MKNFFPSKTVQVFLFVIAIPGCFIVPLSGCINEGKTVEHQTYDKVIYIDEERIIEIEYDGCQYLFCNGFKESSLTHKGNCSNPIHKHNQ